MSVAGCAMRFLRPGTYEAPTWHVQGGSGSGERWAPIAYGFDPDQRHFAWMYRPCP